MSADIKNLVIRPELIQKIPKIKEFPELPSPDTIIIIRPKTRPISQQKIWGPTWYVKFELKISRFPRESEGLTNILHFSTGWDCCKSGSRIPAVFLRWDKKLVVFTDIIGKGSTECVVAQTLSLNTWISVIITQGQAVSIKAITVRPIIVTDIYRISPS